MKKRLYSLKELKESFGESALSTGLELSEAGRYGQAVVSFDMLKDFSALDTRSKTMVRISYCAYAKELQYGGNFSEALRCFSRAREACRDDILVLERTRLLAPRQPYRSWENIAEFRKCFGFGFTSGGYDKYKHPFLEIAREKGILEQSQMLTPWGPIDILYTIGTYRIQAQGRHLLSYKIREYKGKHPFSSANPALARPFAWLLADFVRSETELVRFIDVIVPSPSNPENYVARGFVPSLLIAQELSKCLAIPYKELFSVTPRPCRFRDMPYLEAKKLIRYREKRHDKIVSGNQVLLVDDVITTGTTLMLLADLLKSAGAKAVHGVAIAKTGISKEGS